MIQSIANTILAQVEVGGDWEDISPYTYENEGLSDLISNIIGFLTIVAGLAFLIYFVVGALTWITAGGKTEQVQKAQGQMINAAIGMIVVAASYAIAYIISFVLGVNILNPQSFIDSLPGS